MGFFATAAPILLEVVKNGRSFVVVAGVLIVFGLLIVLSAALVDASILSLLCFELFLLVCLSF